MHNLISWIKTESLQMGGIKFDFAYLHLSISVLLNFDPKKTPEIVQKSNSSSSTLKKLQSTVDNHIIPPEFKLSIYWEG